MVLTERSGRRLAACGITLGPGESNQLNTEGTGVTHVKCVFSAFFLFFLIVPLPSDSKLVTVSTGALGQIPTVVCGLRSYVADIAVCERLRLELGPTSIG